MTVVWIVLRWFFLHYYYHHQDVDREGGRFCLWDDGGTELQSPLGGGERRGVCVKIG